MWSREEVTTLASTTAGVGAERVGTRECGGEREWGRERAGARESGGEREWGAGESGGEREWGRESGGERE